MQDICKIYGQLPFLRCPIGHRQPGPRQCLRQAWPPKLPVDHPDTRLPPPWHRRSSSTFPSRSTSCARLVWLGGVCASLSGIIIKSITACWPASTRDRPVYGRQNNRLIKSLTPYKRPPQPTFGLLLSFISIFVINSISRYCNYSQFCLHLALLSNSIA